MKTKRKDAFGIFRHGDIFNTGMAQGEEDIDIIKRSNIGGTAQGGDTIVPDSTAVYPPIDL